MKLNIGDNIRKYRKQKDMTQEQLADRLGVSYQSVSRWENGATYPDLELLPSIAEMFGITMDELMGMPDVNKEKQAEQVFDELRRECMKWDHYDSEHIVELIRDIRRNHVGSKHAWRPWCEGNDRAFRDPKILPEVRLLAEACLERDPMSVHVIQTMAFIEDEEHLEKFLNKHTYMFDCSERRLLFTRYYRLRDSEKFEPERRYQFNSAIDMLLDDKYLIGWDESPEKRAAANEFALSLLGLLRGDASDTEPDMWVWNRIELGLERAGVLASEGKTDDALSVLRVCVTLLEETMKITDKVTLPITCRWLDGMEWTAEEDWYAPHNDPDEPLERTIFIATCMNRMTMCNVICPSHCYNTLCGSSFDSLRENPEFASLSGRVKALIVTKPPQSEE